MTSQCDEPVLDILWLGLACRSLEVKLLGQRSHFWTFSKFYQIVLNEQCEKRPAFRILSMNAYFIFYFVASDPTPRSSSAPAPL